MSELDRKVRRAVLSVKRRQLTTRIEEFILFCREQGLSYTSSDIGTHFSARVNVRGALAQYILDRMGAHGERTNYRVLYGGKEMLNVHVGPLDIAEGVDPRRVIRIGSGRVVVVDLFLPGCWMEPLDLKRFRRKLERAEERRKKEEENARLASEAARKAYRSPQEDDYSIASRFGIRV